MGSPREIVGDAYEWAGWERVSHGVNCTEFLDRRVAFDHAAGRLVEVPGAWAQRSGQPD